MTDKLLNIGPKSAAWLRQVLEWSVLQRLSLVMGLHTLVLCWYGLWLLVMLWLLLVYTPVVRAVSAGGWLAAATVVPMTLTTLIGHWPLPMVLTVTTLFFMCMSGRMIPGMAILTSAANPALRGTFMTLNASVQSAGMGLAAFLGGLIISRDAQGLVQHYWMSAVLGAIATGYLLGIVEGLTKVVYPQGAAVVIFVVMAIVLPRGP